MCVLKVEHVCAERQHVQWRRKLKIFGGTSKESKNYSFLDCYTVNMEYGPN